MELAGGEVRVIGHRGAAALAPENSLAALEAAAANGADAGEIDVRPGAPGAGGGAHEPEAPDAPSLDAALALARRLGLAVQVDVKEPGLEYDVVGALARHELRDRSFVSAH